jgi:heme exporter protein D
LIIEHFPPEGIMDVWNVALLVAAAYVAITALARLMIRRRNQLMEQFRQEVEKEKRRRDAQQARAPKSRRDQAA